MDLCHRPSINKGHTNKLTYWNHVMLKLQILHIIMNLFRYMLLCPLRGQALRAYDVILLGTFFIWTLTLCMSVQLQTHLIIKLTNAWRLHMFNQSCIHCTNVLVVPYAAWLTLEICKFVLIHLNGVASANKSASNIKLAWFVSVVPALVFLCEYTLLSLMCIWVLLLLLLILDFLLKLRLLTYLLFHF